MQAEKEYRSLHEAVEDMCQVLINLGLNDVGNGMLDQLRWNHPDPEEVDPTPEVIDLTGESDDDGHGVERQYVPMTPPRQIRRQTSTPPGAPEKPRYL